ncbi:MAG: SPOR domain-containing protein [Gammaproteobacteria bacterium]|nr:SPOR domain-containing protein [Gammaproteobacteria bacterium]MBU4003948.1 SPOR domain-containing protein [Gammaproteobacteria bacterium]MBU4020195.1 SPOR domain-containing protein [Gammaproteobacteria bacterium]MBU4095319.1 SPOR domain-containing protein [Gammaproteobacteria bacterium]MBU4147899.1 SPOR domain-containing protein [Gammaproteobacteria bacterium]
MAQESKRSEYGGESAGSTPADDATLLKKRARRRLIGAVALALLAAIVLPMVMDHQPAPLLKDIQVRIPSPDEGVTQRVTGKLAAQQSKMEKVAAPTAEAVSPVKPISKEDASALPAKSAEKAEAKPIAKAETKPETKAEPKPAADKKEAGESWEVQLGAYQNPASVTILVGKLKQLDLPTYTEKVDTPNGPRTRVRAGPFPTQEAAEKARVRVKIIGVDGPVARKP